MNFLNGEEFGAFKGLAYNTTTQEIGAFVEVFPDVSTDKKLVIVPSAKIDMWTAMGANVITTEETIRELPSAEGWIPYTNEMQGLDPLPNNFVQAAFRPPSMSLVRFISVPSGANIYVSDALIGSNRAIGTACLSLGLWSKTRH